MLRLTSRAMTQFTIQRLPPAQLILDFSAMAVRLILDVEVVGLVVHAVRRALLPLGDACGRLAAALIFIHSDNSGLCKSSGVVSREVRS